MLLGTGLGRVSDYSILLHFYSTPRFTPRLHSSPFNCQVESIEELNKGLGDIASMVGASTASDVAEGQKAQQAAGEHASNLQHNFAGDVSERLLLVAEEAANPVADTADTADGATDADDS